MRHLSSPVRLLCAVAGGLALVLGLLVSAPPAARADQNPDPGSAGGVPCSARTSMSRTDGVITMRSSIRCRTGHNVYRLHLVLDRTGAGGTKGWEYDTTCQRARTYRTCSKVFRFRDVRGKQTYRAIWAGSTYFTDTDGRLDRTKYCKQRTRIGKINCVNYVDRRF